MESQKLTSVSDVLARFTNYLPALMAGLIVLVLGIIVAWIAAKLSVRLLVFLRLDRVVVRLGWSRALEKGDVRHSLFGLVGTAIGAAVFLVFLENAIVIWQLTVLSQLVEKLMQLIPQLATAAVILLAGWGAAVGVSRAVRHTLLQEEFGRPHLAGRFVYAAILVLSVAMALVQLDIAVVIVTGAFLIAFGGLALTFVLAFGLGSKRAVELMWEKRLRDRPDEREKKS